jgi:DNA-binding XRE family transcriptional regulator
MDIAKRKRLEARGWKVGSASEFLGLSPEEAQLVELKLRISSLFRRLREDQNLTQVEVAKRLGSSQSRVAKMEGGDPSVTIDLLIKSLFQLGATNEDLSRAMRGANRKVA